MLTHVINIDMAFVMARGITSRSVLNVVDFFPEEKFFGNTGESFTSAVTASV